MIIQFGLHILAEAGGYRKEVNINVFVKYYLAIGQV